MKRFLLAGVASLLFAGSALAQTPGATITPQVGYNIANLRQWTYSASSVGIVPAAAATDLVCINASPNRTVAVRRVEISGISTTAVTAPVVLLKRATQDTGGTAATGLALPVAYPNLSTNGAPTATFAAYTANPTITDAAPGVMRVNTVAFQTTASAAATDVVIWGFGTSVEQYDQGVDLTKGSTQQLCVNFNGVTITGGAAYIDFEWTEQ